MAAAMGYYPDTDKQGCGQKIRSAITCRICVASLKAFVKSANPQIKTHFEKL
jgi:hypothetical protein